ncbi:TatD family hydrolase [Candidatus Anaplasma sp. TIGMIC]|uniref:TatD family hydrolase n=1 Tax=Candidatus Anaplasma sp. TIGMIC TaxID=3020713 RepID=UPI00232ABF69|nr:TatD family hydrolase [Candidatus Anaplasma sp. TIGMIC]MDB1135771.1 TatD family hydrolase [Candidatus Anaplasma sp. TIGMIC]
MIVDSHCHLNYFDPEEVRGIVDRANAVGVSLMQTVCTTMQEFPTLLEIANNHEQVYASVGVHPCNSAKGEQVSADDLIKFTQEEKVIGIGETGLDFYKCDDGIDRQEKSFVEHIAAARETGLPIIIHSRDADTRMADICTAEMKVGVFKGLMHCFASSQELARRSLDAGLYISFSGILTFKNAGFLREIAKFVPRDRVVVETDAPFLCPEPHRGKKNSPEMTRFVVECLAQIWNESVDTVSDITTQNFFTLFDKCSRRYHAS